MTSARAFFGGLAFAFLSVAAAAVPAKTLDQDITIDDVFGGTGPGSIFDDSLGQASSFAVEQTLLARIAEAPKDIGARKKLALLYDATGRYDDAVAQLEAVLAETPDAAEIAIDIVTLVGRAHGPAAAVERLKAFARDAADPFPFRMSLIQLEAQQGRSDAAIAELRDLVAADPGPDHRKVAGLLLARLLYDTGAYAEAEAAVSRVLDTGADDVVALGFRAALRLKLLDLNGALDDVRHGLAIDPRNVRLLRIAVTAEARAGNPDAAFEKLARAVDESGHDPLLTVDYADTLMQRGDPEAARRALTEALAAAPEDFGLLSSLGTAEVALSDWDAAEATVVRLRALGGPEAIRRAEALRVAVLDGRGQSDEAMRVLQQFAGDGTDIGAVAAVVQGYLGQGDADRAAAYVDALMAKNPGAPGLLLVRGALHQNAGELDAAEAMFVRAVELVPASPAAHLSLARLRLLRDGPEAAETALRDGLSASPDAPQLLMPLADILVARGDPEAAVEVLEGLVARFPDQPIVANNYAALVAEHFPEDRARLDRAFSVAGRLASAPVPQFRDTYGWLLYVRGDVRGAAKVLEGVVTELPEDPWSNYHYGVILAKLGQNGAALEHLQVALDTKDASFSESDHVVDVLAQIKR